MSPTTRSSTSSSTPRVPSPTLRRHRTWTLTTLHSASCSLRHTENTPITAVRKVCQSVSRRCLLCSIEQGNLWGHRLQSIWIATCSCETVKSTSPLQKNGYENGYENCTYSTNNINMSDEDNKHDTNYINKNDTNNHDARKLHE